MLTKLFAIGLLPKASLYVKIISLLLKECCRVTTNTFIPHLFSAVCASLNKRHLKRYLSQLGQDTSMRVKTAFAHLPPKTPIRSLQVISKRISESQYILTEALKSHKESRPFPESGSTYATDLKLFLHYFLQVSPDVIILNRLMRNRNSLWALVKEKRDPAVTELRWSSHKDHLVMLLQGYERKCFYLSQQMNVHQIRN